VEKDTPDPATISTLQPETLPTGGHTPVPGVAMAKLETAMILAANNKRLVFIITLLIFKIISSVTSQQRDGALTIVRIARLTYSI
jgi:hypothetical protein